MPRIDRGPPADDCAYAYLLGLYHGDGCLSPHPRGTGFHLRIACADSWPSLFPQHGPGKKHERAIVLEPRQRVVVDAHPWEFVRGLVHSDGCRITDWTTRMVAGQRKRYEYPRYLFTNNAHVGRRY